MNNHIYFKEHQFACIEMKSGIELCNNMNLSGTNIEIDPIKRFKLAATELHLSI